MPAESLSIAPWPAGVAQKNGGAGKLLDGIGSASDAADDIELLNYDLQYHEASGRWLVIVTDRRTGEVKHTVPPEELLDTIGRVRQMIGLLLDARA